MRGCGGRSREPGAAVCGRDNIGNGVGSQQWQWRGQEIVAEAEAVQGQTAINQKAVGIAAEIMLVAMAVAAAILTTAMARAAMQQPWQW